MLRFFTNLELKLAVKRHLREQQERARGAKAMSFARLLASLVRSHGPATVAKAVGDSKQD